MASSVARLFNILNYHGNYVEGETCPTSNTSKANKIYYS